MTRTKKNLALFLSVLFLLPTLFIANTALAAITIQRVFRTGPDAITVYYTPVASATSHVVSVTYSGNTVSKVNNTNGIATLNGLLPGRRYSVTVAGGGDSGVYGPFTLEYLSYGNNWNYGYPYYPIDPNARYAVNSSSSFFYGSGNISYTVEVYGEQLRSVAVANKVLREGIHYTVSYSYGNKCVVTLLESYLNTLSPGYHKVGLQFRNGGGTVMLDVKSVDKPQKSSASGRTGSSATGNGQTLSSVSIYSRASSKGKKLGSFSKGTKIFVSTFTSSGSYAVIDFGGIEGYIKGDSVYAELNNSLTGVTSRNTALYTRKSTSSRYSYASVNKGTALTLLAREGKYWKVNFNDDILYIQAKYVSNLRAG